ncbi:MAG: response regulator transcription factor [Anaerolineales bacterium]|nr:MAG: response regulator transcription factor [Anaerolineales bacterium]
MTSASVYIVDEHDAVRAALAERLGHASDLRVIGHAGKPDIVMAEVRKAKPSIVLLEVKRKDGMGLELVRQIAALAAPPRLAVLTSYPTKWEEEAALRAGADAYLLKNIDSKDLIDRIAQLAIP